MTLPGETISTGAPAFCISCKTDMKLEVLMSGAGYYIGTQCNCGPYSRESGYFLSHDEALTALDEGFTHRDTNFVFGVDYGVRESKTASTTYSKCLPCNGTGFKDFFRNSPMEPCPLCLCKGIKVQKVEVS